MFWCAIRHLRNESSQVSALFSAPDTSLFVSVCFSDAETFSPDVDGRGLGCHAPLPQPTMWAWFCGLGSRALDSLGSGSQDQVDAGMTDAATPQHCTRPLSQTLGSFHFGVAWSDPTQ